MGNVTPRPRTARGARALAASLAIGLAALLGACGGGSGSDGVALTPGVAADGTVVIVGTDGMRFIPDPLTVTAGKRNFVFDNVGVIYHEIAISVNGQFLMRRSIPGGTTYAFSLQLAPGTYEVSCHEPGHYEAGMKSTLIVT
jgi:uncharacterized cupredoxin-like copper-binding protein